MQATNYNFEKNILHQYNRNHNNKESDLDILATVAIFKKLAYNNKITINSTLTRNYNTKRKVSHTKTSYSDKTNEIKEDSNKSNKKRKKKPDELMQKVHNLRSALENEKDKWNSHHSWPERDKNEIINTYANLTTEEKEEIKMLPMSYFHTLAQANLSNLGVHVSPNAIRNQMKWEPFVTYFQDIFPQKN